MQKGFVKFYREWLEHPVIHKDPDYFTLWCYLWLKATHTEMQAVFAGNTIILRPGQLITGRKSLAVNNGIDESKVYRILKAFKNEQLIEQRASNQNTLITLLWWDDTQRSEQRNEQQVNNERTTSEQRVNTNKNIKNYKNEKKYIELQRVNRPNTKNRFNNFHQRQYDFDEFERLLLNSQ